MKKSPKKQTGRPSAALSRSKPAKAARKDAATTIRTGTKQSTAIEMLRSRDDTTIDALTKATSWQRHSVRGFLAGVVRKRLKLDLESSLRDGVRVYRIRGERGANSVEQG